MAVKLKKKKKVKNKLTNDQIIERKKRREFQKQIQNIFIFSGFTSLAVKRQFFLGGRSHELDHCFIYQNIIIICEDTLRAISETTLPSENHKLKKQETAKMIHEHPDSFIDVLKQDNPQCLELSSYNYNQFKIFYLYFEYGKKMVLDAEKERYSDLMFIDTATMNYFVTMSKSIKASFKYELFRYLNLRKDDIGIPNPTGNLNYIKTSIIYPDSVTGFSNGIRMVSFMMRPSDLIENSCVLRKDGWDKKVDLYQRLISPNRIKSIREFVYKNNSTFLNNIIVTLPEGIKFFKKTENGTNEISLDKIIGFDHDIEMQIPVDFNSMAIIDGQHRVYAYYEDYDKNNSIEKSISGLRLRLNLLVTGIIYPPNSIYDDDLEKRKFESNLFVSINKNAKPVDADTLIQVQSIMNPTSGEAISRKVIQQLNKDEPFKDLFQLSKVEDAPIKTASIIQYALSSLLVAKNNPNSLYTYWLRKNHKDDQFRLESSADINDYINYCTKKLKVYFNSIKNRFPNFWNKNSKLLKVISLNAFIIAYRETLNYVDGPKDKEFYGRVLEKMEIDFNPTNTSFKYAGAQYSKFAKTEIVPLFEEVYNDMMNKDQISMG